MDGMQIYLQNSRQRLKFEAKTWREEEKIEWHRPDTETGACLCHSCHLCHQLGQRCSLCPLGSGGINTISLPHCWPKHTPFPTACHKEHLPNDLSFCIPFEPSTSVKNQEHQLHMDKRNNKKKQKVFEVMLWHHPILPPGNSCPWCPWFVVKGVFEVWRAFFWNIIWFPLIKKYIVSHQRSWELISWFPKGQVTLKQNPARQSWCTRRCSRLQTLLTAQVIYAPTTDTFLGWLQTP